VIPSGSLGLGRTVQAAGAFAFVGGGRGLLERLDSPLDQ